jgi:hypothetical protein
MDVLVTVRAGKQRAQGRTFRDRKIKICLPNCPEEAVASLAFVKKFLLKRCQLDPWSTDRILGEPNEPCATIDTALHGERRGERRSSGQRTRLFVDYRRVHADGVCHHLQFHQNFDPVPLKTPARGSRPGTRGRRVDPSNIANPVFVSSSAGYFRRQTANFGLRIKFWRDLAAMIYWF